MALAAAATLAACSLVPKEATLDQAQARFTGMTPAQVQSCMGAPATQGIAANGQTLWTYTPGLLAMSAPVPQADPSMATFAYTPYSGGIGGQSMAAAAAPPPPASCMVTLTFDAGTVATVMYSGPNGGPPLEVRACRVLAGRCMP